MFIYKPVNQTKVFKRIDDSIIKLFHHASLSIKTIYFQFFT